MRCHRALRRGENARVDAVVSFNASLSRPSIFRICPSQKSLYNLDILPSVPNAVRMTSLLPSQNAMSQQIRQAN